MTSLGLRRGCAIAAAAFVLGAAGCGGDEERGPAGGDASTTTTRSAKTFPPGRPATAPAKRAAPALRPARCPAGLVGCRAVTGRVLYVERVDPDGDGDAHFVLAGGSVTAPGFSAIDVRAGLRPDPLPGEGDTVTAAGQVQTGSKGQSQIHAVEVRVRYRR